MPLGKAVMPVNACTVQEYARYNPRLCMGIADTADHGFPPKPSLCCAGWLGAKSASTQVQVSLPFLRQERQRARRLGSSRAFLGSLEPRSLPFIIPVESDLEDGRVFKLLSARLKCVNCVSLLIAF